MGAPLHPPWQGEGIIINMADVEATHTGPRHPAYATSKHALRGFSKSCYEVGPGYHC